MRYFIISGEASGDLHGAALIKALQQKDPQVDIQCWGGDKMEQAGGKVLKHINELSFFGFVEVIINIRTILKNIKECKSQIDAFNPNIIIFIDYPGFNLKMLKWAKQKNYKTIFYVLPHVWIWKESRVHILRKYCDHILAILPFEQDYCNRKNLKATYIGNPLTEYIHQFKQQSEASKPSYIIIFAGSRKSEIKHMLPTLLKVTHLFPNEKFKILKSSHIQETFYAKYLTFYPKVELISAPSFKALNYAKAAIVKSGTSTLETALMKVPMVVVYKFNLLNFIIALILAKIKYISLPNLITDCEIVKELIQYKFTVKNVRKELHKLLYEKSYIYKMLKHFEQLEKKLIVDQFPSHEAARVIESEINSPPSLN